MEVNRSDDWAALDYIYQRGYASYSSLKNVRDEIIPGSMSGVFFDHGTELHSRFLEGKILQKFEAGTEEMLIGMIKALQKNKITQVLMKGAKVEQEFHQSYKGLMVKGYIDIKNMPRLADLKTFTVAGMLTN